MLTLPFIYLNLMLMLVSFLKDGKERYIHGFDAFGKLYCRMLLKREKYDVPGGAFGGWPQKRREEAICGR